jgi:S1-C subfamily serine protease
MTTLKHHHLLATVLLLITAISTISANELQILEGRYGDDSSFVDVTIQLKEKASGGRIEMTVNNDAFGTDPAPGKPKSLRVTYREEGQLAEATVSEGNVLALPKSPSHPADTTTLPASAANLDDFMKAVEEATVVIEYNISDRASGATGFLIEHQGKKYIATNLHVLKGEASTEAQLIWYEGPRQNMSMPGRMPQFSRLKTSYQDFQKHLARAPLPKIKSHAGETLNAGSSLLLSETRDIALIPVETELQPLQISATSPRRDEDIFVVGNPEAEHTIAVLEGAISAMGPERIELSIRNGELKPGMSGGPVVNSATGQVIGAIAYKVEKMGSPDKKFSVEQIFIEDGPRITRVKANYEMVVRNFAFRLDNISDLEPITWQQFLLDCGTLHAMNERTMNVNVASRAPYHSNYQIEIPPDFDSSVAMAYRSAIRSLATTGNPLDFEKKWNAYQRSLENLLNQDISNPKFAIRTPYIQQAVKTDLSDERRVVSTNLRASSGKIPSRGER